MVERNKAVQQEPPPGVYRVIGYASGTITVTDGKFQKTRYGVRGINPHLYVIGPIGLGEDETQTQRWLMAGDLEAWLNGGIRPEWLDDMNRISETRAVHPNGAVVLACGPHVDHRPPTCMWVEDESDSAKSRRARLMDRVFGINSGAAI